MKVLRRALDGVRLQNDITADRLAHNRFLQINAARKMGEMFALASAKYFEVEAPTFSDEAFPTSQHTIKYQH